MTTTPTRDGPALYVKILGGRQISCFDSRLTTVNRHLGLQLDEDRRRGIGDQ